LNDSQDQIVHWNRGRRRSHQIKTHKKEVCALAGIYKGQENGL
jgi:hypothetical protein